MINCTMNLKIPNNFKLPGTLITWGQVRNSFAKNLRETFKKLPDDIRTASKKLAEKGWFLSLDIPISACRELSISPIDDTTESKLVEFYKARTDQILVDLNTAFPERAHLFQSAFEVHNQKNYNASIPLILAQAEGICVDMLDVKLFSKPNGVPITKCKVEDRIKKGSFGGIIEAFVEPLLSGSALSLNKKEMRHRRNKHSGYDVLNRHEILHGSDKNYGSEVNSLRAISLLDYLMGLKKYFENP